MNIRSLYQVQRGLVPVYRHESKLKVFSANYFNSFENVVYQGHFDAGIKDSNHYLIDKDTIAEPESTSYNPRSVISVLSRLGDL